jgi:hypothetical protein
MPSLTHHHTFDYLVENSTVSDIPNHRITFRIDGDSNLSEMIAKFSDYLKACGFVFPDNHHLDVVPDDDHYVPGPEPAG